MFFPGDSRIGIDDDDGQTTLGVEGAALSLLLNEPTLVSVCPTVLARK